MENNIKVEILLKDVREQKEVSLEQLATMTEISESKLKSIENNKKEPTLFELVQIAETLDVELEKLYKVIIL